MTEIVTYVDSCFLCHKEWRFPVSLAGLNRWRGGELIQNALPDLPREKREFLISRMCHDCWIAMFEAEEHEEAAINQCPSRITTESGKVECTRPYDECICE